VSKRTFEIQKGRQTPPIKAVVYGSGGIGKSELVSLLAKQGVNMLFLDLEYGTQHLDVNRVSGIQTFDELRSILHDDALMAAYDGVAIDSLTSVEELAVKWVVANIPHEKGKKIQGIEDYGFGKGFTHVFESLLLLLGDLDALVRRGKHVVCVAHECITTPENPDGENFAKAQPRLQTTKDGKNSFRYRVREWCDHLLYIKYDVAVVEGKGVGGGSRTIYTQEMPTYWAKSRSLSGTFDYPQGDATVWARLLGK
jgi:hypothetical protein